MSHKILFDIKEQYSPLQAEVICLGIEEMFEGEEE